MPRVKLHISVFLLAVMLAVLVSFSALMCLTEAFSLSCDSLHLLLACGAAALASAAAMLPRRTWLVSLTGLAVWLGLVIWMRQPLETGLSALLHGITAEYATVYGGVAVVGQAGDCLLLLSFLSLPLCWLTAWVICREGNALFLLLVCLPILLLCLIIVELAPILWLVVLTFSLLMLLMTHSVRERSTNEAGRLAWWLVLPAIILVTAITVIWPPADYERTDLAEQLRAVAEDGLQIDDLREISENIVPTVPQWTRDLRDVDLSRIGPKSMNGRVVMESKASRSRYYLRGASLAVYEDNTWSAADPAGHDFSSLPLLSGQGSGQTETLEIYAARAEDLLYTTYHPASLPETAECTTDAYVRNSGKLRSYTLDYASESTGGTSVDYDIYVNQTYTQIPDDLRAELEAFLAQSGWGAAATPEELASFVRNSAVYDLNTPRIPLGADFVLYFLQESNRGYCVHFATATVMLLRTMHIPARYVTGYSVTGTAGEWTVVTEDDAHAWVEYYVNGVGWLPLEPTPASEETELTPNPSAETDSEEPQPTPDSPEETQPETQPEEKPEDAENSGSVGRPQLETVHWSWTLLLPAALLLVLLRYWFGLHRRKDRCRRGHPNRRAMAYWRWLVQLARTEGTSLEEELICLAEKARFSQHTLSEEELEQLRLALEQRIARLRQYPAGKQLWFRFGLILY